MISSPNVTVEETDRCSSVRAMWASNGQAEGAPARRALRAQRRRHSAVRRGHQLARRRRGAAHAQLLLGMGRQRVLNVLAYVRGYIGGHNFATGPASKHTFVIECDGHLYPASRHTAAGGIDRRGDETTGKVAYIATATATVSTLLWPVLVVKATKLLPRRHPCKVARGSYRPATAGGG